MVPEVSLPHSQAPATCPCPKPDQSSSLRLVKGSVLDRGLVKCFVTS